MLKMNKTKSPENPRILKSQENSQEDISSKLDAKIRRLEEKKYVSLSKTETWLYFLIWIGTVVWYLDIAVKASSKYRDLILPRLRQYQIPEWLGGGSRYRDMSPGEHEVFSDSLKTMVPYYFLHFIGAQIVRKCNPKLLPVFYFLLSSVFLIHFASLKALLFLLGQPILVFLLHYTNSITIIWIAAVGYGCGMSVSNSISEYEQYMTRRFLNSKQKELVMAEIWVLYSMYGPTIELAKEKRMEMKKRKEEKLREKMEKKNVVYQQEEETKKEEKGQQQQEQQQQQKKNQEPELAIDPR